MKKLCSNRGASLTEMLVAIAVLGLLTLAVATGITSSIPVYRDSTALSESSILASTLAQALQTELRYAQDVELEEAGGTFYLKSYTRPNLERGAALTSEGGHIMVNDTDLIGSGAYTTLAATVDVTFEEPYFNVAITITQGGREVRSIHFPVRPLNPVT